MAKADKDRELSRRGFLKAVGLGTVAAAGMAAAPALAAAPQSGGQAAPTAQTLPKRTLGKTGLQVSILCLGGMFDTINNQLLLKQAWNWGVNFWDTAEAYGNGLSEEGYGRYLSRNPDARKDMVLSTKLVLKGGNLTERLDKSLKRLHTDYVDLFCAHGISSIDELDPSLKTWAAEMKKAGKIKNFGFSSHANMEECMLGAAKLDWIDAVLVSYNFRLMHEQKMKDALAACTKAGIGVVAMKTQGGGPVKTDSEAELKMAGRFLERGFTDKQAKLKGVWDTKDIASICSQMPNLTILAANVAAGRDKTSLAEADREALRRYAMATRHDYCAGCGEICQEAMAGQAPVNDVMRCLMYYRDYGDQDLARSVFAALPADTRTALGSLDYSAAEKACPRKLAIAQLMREAVELLA